VPFTVTGLLGNLASRVIADTDTDDDKLAKTLVIFASGLMGFAATLWLAIYWAMGIRFSATVPLVYLAVSAASLGFYLWKRNFVLFRSVQVLLFLFVPFIMQWSIGSFVTSSGVMLWALLAPLGVMLFQGSRQSVPWFVAYVVLTALSGVFDYYLGYGDKTVNLPLQTIAVFFVLNFVAMSAILYLLVVFFVREKQRLRTALEQQHELLAQEQGRSERLLLNVLPAPIAQRLKDDPAVIADGYADVTVMFADLIGFTRMSEELPPKEMVALLNRIFSWFDELAERHGLEKIKTVGDAYMAAGGILESGATYTEAVADMALEMRAGIARFRMPDGRAIGIHAGIASGPVVAGVIGVKKFIYDLWGQTVNVANRLSIEAVDGGILVDATTWRRLKNRYAFEPPISLVMKSQRQLEGYWLTSRLTSPLARPR